MTVEFLNLNRIVTVRVNRLLQMLNWFAGVLRGEETCHPYTGWLIITVITLQKYFAGPLGNERRDILYMPVLSFCVTPVL